MKNSNIRKKQLALSLPIIVGVILIIAGLCISIPGTALTTLSSLNGVETAGYNLGNRYSTIDEYVGGDAFNFIISATIISGKLTGIIAVKGLCIVSGVLCVCLGASLLLWFSTREPIDYTEDSPVQQSVNNTTADIPILIGEKKLISDNSADSSVGTQSQEV